MSALLLALLVGAADDAKVAFEHASLAACLAQPEWTGRAVRVSLVVHEGGGWALGVEADEVPPAMLRPARECLEAATLTAVDSLPAAKATRVLVRTVEGPPAPADRVGELKARFEEQREGVVACVLRLMPVGPVKASVPVTLSLSKRGGVTVTAEQPEVVGPRLAHCARKTLGFFAPGKASVTLTVDVVGEGLAASPRGAVGDVCSWGERDRRDPDGEFLPDPHGCGPGLQCCGGGPAGSTSHCRSAPEGCPRLP